MATVYVAEFTSIAGRSNFAVQAPFCPPITEQTVAVSTASVQSSAFSDNTNFIRVHTDAICSIAFSSDPTAASSVSMRLAANQTEYFGVVPGQKMAVIVNT